MLSTKTIISALDDRLIDPLDVFEMDRYNLSYLIDTVYDIIEAFRFDDYVQKIETFYSQKRKKHIVTVSVNSIDHINDIYRVLSWSKLFNVILTDTQRKKINAILK